MISLTQERARELFNYDPETGVVTRKAKSHPRCPVVIGEVVGSCKSNGYAKVSVDGGQYLLHRVIYLYMTGSFPVHGIDHINGKRDDNRWVNLRPAGASLNNQNYRKAGSHNRTSALLGVDWRVSKQKWRAAITINNRSRHIGYFETAEAAHAAYLEVKRKLHAGCTI
jgi:hypothetical protein